MVTRLVDAVLDKLGRRISAHMEVKAEALSREELKEIAKQIRTYRREKEDEVRAIRVNSNEFVVKVIELERKVNEAVRGIQVERLVIEKMLASKDRASRMVVAEFRAEAEAEVPEFRPMPEVMGKQLPGDQHELDLHSFLEDISSN